MPFEYMVRPFQTPDLHGRVFVPSTPSASTQRATLTWGSKAAGTNALPAPKTVGYNTKCCNETLTEASRSGEDHKITGTNNPENWITVNRASEISFDKEDKDECGGGLLDDSYVASGVRQAFSEMNALIHASDGAFLPTGSKGCKAKTTLKNG